MFNDFFQLGQQTSNDAWQRGFVVRLILALLMVGTMGAGGIWGRAAAFAQQAEGIEQPSIAPEQRLLLNVPVVELFTSQGCPNCPRADATLATIATRGNVLALSLHVDYWDYTGWVDPHGSAANTQRQMAYKDSLDVPFVFTPQFVLNGKLVMESQAVSGLEMALKMFEREAQAIQLKASTHQPNGLGRDGSDGGDGSMPEEWPDGASYTVMLPYTQLVQPVDLRIVYFDMPKVTIPTSGRNKGRALFNAHSVLGWEALPDWQGEPRQVGLHDGGHYGAALLISDKETRAILATAALVTPLNMEARQADELSTADPN